jgi:hypothetical protein
MRSTYSLATPGFSHQVKTESAVMKPGAILLSQSEATPSLIERPKQKF